MKEEALVAVRNVLRCGKCEQELYREVGASSETKKVNGKTWIVSDASGRSDKVEAILLLLF